MGFVMFIGEERDTTESPFYVHVQCTVYMYMYMYFESALHIKAYKFARDACIRPRAQWKSCSFYGTSSPETPYQGLSLDSNSFLQVQILDPLDACFSTRLLTRLQKVIADRYCTSVIEANAVNDTVIYYYYSSASLSNVARKDDVQSRSP